MKAFCTFLFFLIFTAAANACPICNSATAKKVRASLFGPDLLYNLAVTIVPFAIFAIIIMLMYNGGRLPMFQKNKEVV